MLSDHGDRGDFHIQSYSSSFSENHLVYISVSIKWCTVVQKKGRAVGRDIYVRNSDKYADENEVAMLQHVVRLHILKECIIVWASTPQRVLVLWVAYNSICFHVINS